MITIKRKINQENLEEIWIVIHDNYPEYKFYTKEEAVKWFKDLKEDLISLD
jgi:hypothetical protein